jgi:hypothetical protein
MESSMLLMQHKMRRNIVDMEIALRKALLLKPLFL